MPISIDLHVKFAKVKYKEKSTIFHLVKFSHGIWRVMYIYPTKFLCEGAVNNFKCSHFTKVGIEQQRH